MPRSRHVDAHDAIPDGCSLQITARLSDDCGDHEHGQVAIFVIDKLPEDGRVFCSTHPTLGPGLRLGSQANTSPIARNRKTLSHLRRRCSVASWTMWHR